MNLYPVKVECHSGYKADEYPRSFTWKEETFVIAEIIDRWYEGYQADNPSTADYFKVKTSMGIQYLLKHVHKSDEWFLVKK